MNPRSFKAFGDELLKIAFADTMVNGFKDALKWGWHGDPNAVPGSFMEQRWGGQGLATASERAGMGRIGKAFDTATSLGGATKYLPVGAKSMMALGTALQAREALKDEDATGQGRSKTERMTGVAGNALGSLAGAGKMMKMMPNHPIIANIVGGVGGGIIGEKVTTAPWRMRRKLLQRPIAPSQMQYQGPYSQQGEVAQ